MGYKYKKITPISASFAMKSIRDFLVNDVGWTDETPVNQDDPDGFILGYFLKSTGESADKEIFINLRLNMGRRDDSLDRNYHATKPAMYNYLASGINTTDTTITLNNGDGFPDTANFTDMSVRIDDEIIHISAKSGTTLTVSQRGYRGTTPASHSADAVVLLESCAMDSNLSWDATLVCRVAAFRDLTSPIIASKAATSAFAYGASTWNDSDYDWEGGKQEITTSNCTGYGDHLSISQTAYMKITEVGGNSEGVIRPIVDYTSTTGRMLVMPFKNTPNTNSDFEVLSPGFLMSGWYHKEHYQYFWTEEIPCYVGANTLIFLYANKDNGLATVSRLNGEFVFSFFGNVDTMSESSDTNTTSDIAIGATSIPVTDGSIFTEGAYYRIISRDMNDWDANDTVVSPTFYGDEGPTELIYVSSISVNTLTVSPTKYAYKSGAVIGDNPRPLITSISRTSERNNVKETLDYGGTNGENWIPIIYPRAEGCTYRAIVHDGAPSFSDSYADDHFCDAYNIQEYMAGNWPDVFDDQEDKPVGRLVYIYNDRYSATGGPLYRFAYGTLPFVRLIGTTAPYGGGALDTVKVRFNGSMEDFRVIKESAAQAKFYIVGPEIA